MNVSKKTLIKYIESEQKKLAENILETGVEQRTADEIRGQHSALEELKSKLDDLERQASTY